MLDTDTKRRIDTARDILVGKVPDPKSQVEQITIALIYKFMDDMDAESEELGGDRQFFTGKFAAYGWSRLMSPSVGGHELIRLYDQGISTMPENPGIPVLFRDIFKNAYLPYRDPETLKSFLKIINEFSYDHSEKLGDAFEYLLSVLGSQGDAGQFRTPRHIIDFIVEIIQPQKGEVILDPACGTAGFLISAYKHILRNNRDVNNISTLTPDEKGYLAKNFLGYDISPDMVRLSLVNLYLHGFNDPHIIEYDTLTSEDRWNQFADVILANPPFMSPKGGIKPHKRFSIKAKRSEVLFVDYIAEHLTPKGRAGIIVPEGIIFQSQTAYKDLRRMLLNNALVAVISLPAGVFNPYSGVKTSILILDKSLAKLSDTVAFFKVENDGFGLGAQRREVTGEQLTKVQIELELYLQAVRNQELTDNFELTLGLVVPKVKIAANGDYNFSGERYREVISSSTHFPTVKIGDVCDLVCGSTPSKQNESYWQNGTVKWISAKYIDDQGHIKGSDLISEKAIEEKSTKIAPKSSTIIITRVSVGKFAFADDDYAINQDLTALISKDSQILAPEFILVVAPHIAKIVERNAEGIGVRGVTRSFVSEIKIPLPPIAIQQEIVTEIEGYQKVINGARAVIDNYRPHIPIDSDWQIIKLGEICSFKNGLNFTKSESGYTVKIIGIANFQSNLYAPLDDLNTIHLDAPIADDYLVKKDDILFVRSNGNIDLVGRSIIVPPPQEPTTFSGFTIRGRIEDDRALPIFFAHFFKSRDFADMIKTVGRGANIRNLSQGILNELEIPLPPIEIQKAIVAEIEAEQTLVNANRELITRFEKKIQTTLNRIWGEE